MTPMAGGIRARISEGWRLVAHSLSGRLLLLTLLYVLVSEAVILVPSIGSYHRGLLDNRVESAEIAILPFTEAVGERLSANTRAQLLIRAGAAAVMLRRPEQRELFLRNVVPSKIDAVIDLRSANILDDMSHALDCLFAGSDRMLQVIAPTHIAGAQGIDVIMDEAPIRAALVQYSTRAFFLALAISLAAALLVFFSLYLILVRPMRNITHAMVNFRENPEDAGRIVSASARKDEIGVAERELGVMQREIYGSLQQKARLVALGTAVAKIQHDLRNILSSAQLASDRLATSEDPAVQRLAPRLVASIDHAVALATNTLRYGRADEHPPQRKRLVLAPLVEEAGENAIAAKAADKNVQLDNKVDGALEIDADPEQMFRIVLNLLRNAAEAVAAGGNISVTASRESGHVTMDVTDNGSGIPAAVKGRLFQPFASTARPDGSGLGLAIARDLARAHGGNITLVKSDAGGTTFRVQIPDRQER